MALAHAVGNKVEAAYRRGDLFEKRRRLMDDWAAHCSMPIAALSGGYGRITGEEPMSRKPAGARNPTEEESPGLAGASDADIERALEIARDAHDAKVMRDLRAHLDDVMKTRQAARNLTRERRLGTAASDI